MAGGGWKVSLLSGLVGVLIGAVAMAAFSGYFVRRYLLAHPEVLPEAMEVLQARETARQDARWRRWCVPPRGARGPVPRRLGGRSATGRRPGRILRYACGYSGRARAFDRLLREDPRLRVGGASSRARPGERTGRIREPRRGAGRALSPILRRSLRRRPTKRGDDRGRSPAAGLGEVALDEEARRELRRIPRWRRRSARRDADFVVGERVLHGAVGYEALRDAIAAVRRARAAEVSGPSAATPLRHARARRWARLSTSARLTRRSPVSENDASLEALATTYIRTSPCGWREACVFH